MTLANKASDPHDFNIQPQPANSIQVVVGSTGPATVGSAAAAMETKTELNISSQFIVYEVYVCREKVIKYRVYLLVSSFEIEDTFFYTTVGVELLSSQRPF